MRCMVVVISFSFVLGTNGLMQPVVMAPKNLPGAMYILVRPEMKKESRAALVLVGLNVTVCVGYNGKAIFVQIRRYM